MSHILHDNFLKKSLTKSNVWSGYKFYERRALIYGVTRISLNKYKKFYWENRSVPVPV